MPIVNSIRLQEAYLCITCDVINDNSQHCALCGETKALFPVAKFINRSSDNSVLVVATHSCCDTPNVPCIACNSASVSQ